MLKDSLTPRYKAVRTHRTYSAQFKAELVTMSQQPGASIAALALQHGINSNVLHRWRKEWSQGLHQMAPDQGAVITAAHVPAFVSVPLPAVTTVQTSAPPHGQMLKLHLQHGQLQASVQCTVADCAALLREVLR